MDNLRDLTIIIPTFERPLFAKRSMSYWSGKLPLVIVLDGSSDSLDENYIKSLSRNIRYFHHPEQSFQDRIRKVRQLVYTKYCMLHPDDEFFIPSGLSECIQEIEEDDLVCCLGRCIEFDYKDSLIRSQPWLPLHTAFDGYSLLDDQPLSRMLKHMHPYLCSTIYGVTKSEVFLTNISANLDDIIENFFFEISYEMCSAYQGKSKVINTLSWLRSNENTPFYVKEKMVGTRPLEPYEIILKDDFTSNPIVSKLAKYLNRINEDYSIDLLEEIVYSSFRSYAYQANLTFQIAYLFENNNLEESKEKSTLKKLIGGDTEFKFDQNDKSLKNTSKIWRENGIQSNSEEVEEIEEYILDFY